MAFKKKVIPREDYMPPKVMFKQHKTPEPGSQEETEKEQKMNTNIRMREMKGDPMTGEEGVERNKSKIAEMQREETKKKYKGKKKLIEFK